MSEDRQDDYDKKWFILTSAFALIGAAVFLGTEISACIRAKRLNRSIDNLENVFLLYLDHSFQGQVDDMFDSMLEEGFLEDPDS